MHRFEEMEVGFLIKNRLTRTRSEKYTLSGLTYSPNGGLQQDLAYTYDLEGTILSQYDDSPGSQEGTDGLLREFTHDPLRRLISATGRESSNVYQQPSWDLNIRPEDSTATNAYIRAFSYDKLGNIQELAHGAIGHSNQDFVRNYDYSGDFNNNQLKQFTYGGNTYSYLHDAAGNVIQESSNRYFEWTHNDKPATFSNQAGTSDPTVYTNYFYNAAGERVKKLVKKGQQLEVTFYMDGGLFETSYVKPTGGSIDNNRFYNTLHVLDGSSRISTIRVGTDADDSTPAIKYFLEDHLMDNLVVLKSDGTLINREEFYPFGETSFGGYGKKRYRFNGKEKDEESGLYNYGQRYYAPWLCRFVSVDPIAEKFADLSSYNYAGNRPVTKIDQEGLQEEGRKESPKGGDNGKKQSKDGGEKGKGGETINIAPLPEDLQQKIDDELAKAKESGQDIEINVHQTEDGYSVTKNGEPLHETPQLDAPESQSLELPKDPELAIRDQQKELENNRSNQSPERQEMDPMPSLPAQPVPPEGDANNSLDSVDVLRKAVGITITIKDFILNKSESIFKVLQKAPLKLSKFARGLPVIGFVFAVMDALIDGSKNDWDRNSIIKGALGVGIAAVGVVAFIAAAPVVGAIAGAAAIGLAVWDLSGGMDQTLDNIFESSKTKSFSL